MRRLQKVLPAETKKNDPSLNNSLYAKARLDVHRPRFFYKDTIETVILAYGKTGVKKTTV